MAEVTKSGDDAGKGRLLSILKSRITMKTVIQSVLASRENRNESAVKALVAHSAQAGQPWLPEQDI